jgi:hypothetical protein
MFFWMMLHCVRVLMNTVLQGCLAFVTFYHRRISTHFLNKGIILRINIHNLTNWLEPFLQKLHLNMIKADTTCVSLCIFSSVGLGAVFKAPLLEKFMNLKKIVVNIKWGEICTTKLLNKLMHTDLKTRLIHPQ